ncbi:rhodoquinone biosynthesis methyltransferase RquA [Rickettsiales bacterium LUAb2]
MNNNKENNNKLNIKDIKQKLNQEFTENDLNDIKEYNDIKNTNDINDNFKQKLYDHYDFKFDKIQLDDTELDDEEIIKVSNEFKEIAAIEVPNYLQEVYSWCYLNPKNVSRLDNSLLINLALYGNSNKLIKSYLKEIKPSDTILHIGNNYGKLLPLIAKKLNNTGKLDLIDVIPLQLANALKKLKDFNNVDLWQQDASVSYYRDYSFVGCYFLLHELPLKVKVEVLNNILDQVYNNNAKAVIIDYHHPILYHPLRPILRIVNTILHPFMKDLWEYDIEDLAKEKDNFIWKKTTYFGKMFQKIVITKK